MVLEMVLWDPRILAAWQQDQQCNVTNSGRRLGLDWGAELQSVLCHAQKSPPHLLLMFLLLHLGSQSESNW